MRLANMLKESFILSDLGATTKEGAIEELLELLKREDPSVNLEIIKELIIEREEIENTSYGRGFAFPHARTDEVDDMQILLGVSKTGLKDRTPDNVPLEVIVLLLTPSNISRLYLQTLSAFANFARIEGNLKRLSGARTNVEVVDIIWQSGVRVEKELLVKDMMRRDVATVTAEDSLKKVANLMFKNRLSALAVVDGTGYLLGLITDKDLIQAALPDYRAMMENLNYTMDVEPFEELLKLEEKIKVSQLYKTDHVTTSMETKLIDAAALMIYKDLRRIFVTKDGKLVGILVRKDIVNMIIRG
jgi:mannitol/fructose-specific phosphotransferase system IIA component (Ntr-type)/CBS domain-containing protein